MAEIQNPKNIVNNGVRWTIFSSNAVIALVLIISWILWMTIYRSIIDNTLDFFTTNSYFQGYGITIDFVVLSIFALIIVVISLLLALPFGFYYKKNIVISFMSLLNFILSALILVACTLFVITTYNTYNQYYQDFGLKAVIVWFLPWVLIIIFTFILLFISLWSLIASANNIKTLSYYEAQIANKQKPNHPDQSTDKKPGEAKHNIDEAIIVPHHHQAEKAEPPKEHKPEITHAPTHQHEHEKDDKAMKSAKATESSKKTPYELNDKHITPFAVYHENANGQYVSDQKPQAHNNEQNQKIIITKPREHNKTPKITKKANKEQKDEEKNHAQLAPTPKVWTKTEINEVWAKGFVIKGVNPELYRKDYAGAWMFKHAFSSNWAETNIRSYAWTITHHKPLPYSGASNISNLEPMNIINAMTKGENYPSWNTKISSNGNENIIKEQTWQANNEK